jgi:dihydrofolate reductase
MRKIILSVAVSLDGYIEGPNREVDWLEFNDETGKALNEFLEEIDTVLYGRLSYETWGKYTPTESSPNFEKNFYLLLNKMNKYVFSSSKEEFEGHPKVVKSNFKQVIQKLKQLPGKDIWLYGGSRLISTFMNLDLIDEFRIAIFPVVLGAGNPLFKDVKHSVKLKLIDSRNGKSGVVEFKYERLIDKQKIVN